MKRRSLVTILALLAPCALPVPAGAGADPAGVTTSTVGGSWAQIVNCVFTRYEPSTGDFTCVGGSTWEGSWTGVTHYDVTGRYDPATGDMRGTLAETFVGTYLPGKSHGTLLFSERFAIDGATGVLHIDTDVMSGDGRRQRHPPLAGVGLPGHTHAQLAHDTPTLGRAATPRLPPPEGRAGCGPPPVGGARGWEAYGGGARSSSSSRATQSSRYDPASSLPAAASASGGAGVAAHRPFTFSITVRASKACEALRRRW
ncbi:MAG: hypothetical protein QOJ23_5675 [Actinomycetota bacterium]|nr:hypothetical protein [Actinomycetota bacterium]